MKYELLPYEGFIFRSKSNSIIELLQDKDYYQYKFNLISEEVRRFESQKFKESHYFEIGIIIDFDDENCLAETISFVNNSVPMFKKKKLLELNYKDLKSFFKEIDSELKNTDVGFTSFKYGIDIYAPLGKEEPDNPAEAIMIFVKGYFDE
jgi:hypothetical protein